MLGFVPIDELAQLGCVRAARVSPVADVPAYVLMAGPGSAVSAVGFVVRRMHALADYVRHMRNIMHYHCDPQLRAVFVFAGLVLLCVIPYGQLEQYGLTMDERKAKR